MPTTITENPAVMRHANPRPADRPAIEDPALIAAMSDHIERHVGPIMCVLHEQQSEYVHIDVHVVSPRPDRPFITMVTSGMSAAPMRQASELGARLSYAELVISLRPDWLSRQCGRRLPELDEMNWPLQWLADLARLPHEYDTCVGYGHTWADTDPPSPMPGTPFAGAVLLDPISEPREFQTLEMPDGRHIELVSVWPLYAEELTYRLEHDTPELVEKLLAAGVTDVVDPRRRNVCAPSRRGNSK